MQTVLDVALPVFAVILVGFLAGRARLLGRTQSEALNAFVYWISLPALLFLAMAETPVADTLNVNFVGAYLGGMLVVWVVGSLIGAVVLRRPAQEVILQGMNSGFSNTGYMGIPLFIAAFGRDRGLPPSSLATVMMSAACVGLAVVALELTGRSGGFLRALRDVAGAVLRSPIVTAPMLGIAWSALGVPVPGAFATMLQLLGSAASPCALFAIGLFLAGQTRLRSGLAEVGWITVLKLLWQPLVTWVLAVTIFPMDPFWTASAVILAALPTGTLTFVVAQTYGVYVERTSAVILVSTVVSVVTLSVLLAIYAPRFAPP